MFFSGKMILILLPLILPMASEGNLQDCLLLCLDLNLGNPVPFLKNDLYAASKLIIDCCNTLECTSLSHRYSSLVFKLHNV